MNWDTSENSPFSEEVVMRYFICLVALVSLFTITASGFAGSEIPDLKGTWVIKTSGIGHEKITDPPHPVLHIENLRPVIEFEYIMIIDRQDEFRFSGYTESSRKKEIVSGVIGWDNKSVYITDNDGIHIATLVSPDKMEAVYLHVTPHHSIASRDIITRKR